MIDGATSGAITVAWLEERHACKRQVRLFRKVFGESAESTRENMLKAAHAKMNLRWLATKLLCGREFHAFWAAERLALRTYLGGHFTQAEEVAYWEAIAVVLCDVLGLP